MARGAINSTVPEFVQASVLEHGLLCQQQFKQVVNWLMVIICVGALAFYIDAETLVFDGLPLRFSYIAMIVGSPLLIILVVKW